MSIETKRICPACGREMLHINSWWECSNRQCDYTEDEEAEEVAKDGTRQ